jgi:hypothetical protein
MKHSVQALCDRLSVAAEVSNVRGSAFDYAPFANLARDARHGGVVVRDIRGQMFARAVVAQNGEACPLSVDVLIRRLIQTVSNILRDDNAVFAKTSIQAGAITPYDCLRGPLVLRFSYCPFRESGS